MSPWAWRLTCGKLCRPSRWSRDPSKDRRAQTLALAEIPLDHENPFLHIHLLEPLATPGVLGLQSGQVEASRLGPEASQNMTEVENKGRSETGGAGSPRRPATALSEIIVTLARSASQPVTAESLSYSGLCFEPGDATVSDSLHRQDSFLFNSAL